MARTLDEFVHHRNVAIYVQQLRCAPDARQRGLLVSRLAEEHSQARANNWVRFESGVRRETCAQAVVGPSGTI